MLGPTVLAEKEASPGTTFALGLGLTNECNLTCAFCYRDPTRTDRLQADQVRAVLDALPVRSVNLGTGENGMHPDFGPMLDLLRAEPVKLTITSNGHSVALLSDDDVTAFKDIEFSLDYPTREEQDLQRGAGNWDLVHEQAARCRRLGVGVSIIAVMMKANHQRLAEIAEVAARFDAPLRINVYQAVRTDAFALTYDEYWTAFEMLFARTDVIAIAEPLVRAMAGLPPRVGGCGATTVRVTPRSTVQPCVYWPGAGAPLAELLSAGSDIVRSADFHEARTLPEACWTCRYREPCAGGCAGRRRLLDQIDKPDPYCPIMRGDDKPLRIQLASGRDLPKVDSACTTIVMARAKLSTSAQAVEISRELDR